MNKVNSFTGVRGEKKNVPFILFSLILLDSLVSYFSNTLIGVVYPINALTCGLFLVYAFNNHQFFVRYRPSNLVMVMLGLVLIGFLLGTYHNYYSFIAKIFKTFSALLSFLIGYYAFRQINNERQLSAIFIIVGAIYTLVCFVAVLRLAPGLFPVIDALWADGWTIVSRPEVTTDQNFQVYYLFFFCFSLFFRIPNLIKFFVLFGILLALYSLSQLQTRSGIILYAAAILLSVFGGARIKTINPFYILIIGFVAFVVVVYKMDAIYGMANYLIDRFVNDDYRNLQGRVKSASYVIDLFANPIAWFLPQGLGVFERTFGGLPHSNYTALFLEGGMFTFVGFLALQLFPIFRVSLLFVKYRLDAVTIAALFGALVSLVGSLSLCVPYHEHIYLWMGALIGAELRLRHINNLRRKK